MSCTLLLGFGRKVESQVRKRKDRILKSGTTKCSNLRSCDDVVRCRVFLLALGRRHRRHEDLVALAQLVYLGAALVQLSTVGSDRISLLNMARSQVIGFKAGC